MKEDNTLMVPENDSTEDTIKKIQHYLFNWSDRIGKGSFSDVYLGINQLNQEPVAIKLIKNQSLKSKTAQRLLNHEISILKYLDHPNVIKCHDVFTSLNHCYIITEYCQEGDLEKILKKKKFFQEEEISKIIYDVYKGLEYLSDNLIIHRDIKIANIFFTGNVYKIADFGFSIRSKTLFTDIPVGSPIYMSPEGLINNNYGPKTDVWSFGILLYELLHGETPLDKCRTEEELRINVIKKPQIKASISPELNALIQACLEPNISKRISVQEIKETSYLKRIISLYEKPVISEKLTSTYHSTETSYSVVVESMFDRSFTEEEALSILHYCRLLHKTAIKTVNREFALWLLLIFEGFVKCKIIRSSHQKSPKTENKSQYENLKQVILEYHQKYKNEHSNTKLNLTDKPSFDSVLSECTKVYKECESNNVLNEIKSAVFNLYKETELLNQSFKSNKIGYFAKHSQSKEFLSALGKATVQ